MLLFNEPWQLSISIFERSLAFINLAAFFSSLVQWRGQFGSTGMLPAKDLIKNWKLRNITFWKRPTLCLIWSDSDEFIQYLHYIGILSAILAFLGIFPGLMVLSCWICYSSIHTISNIFMGLQMHANLLETNMLYVLCSAFTIVQPQLLVFIQWTLLFRIMFGGAVGKYTGGDASWKDGTAMTWHYWTQPLPNPLSAYFYRMPLFVHKIETYFTYVSEGLGAILCFTPQCIRWLSFVLFFCILFGINFTGNYAHLAPLTITEMILLLNDNVWTSIISVFPFSSYILSFLHQTSNTRFSMPNLTLFQYPVLNLIPWLLIALPYCLISFIPLKSTFHDENPFTWPIFTRFTATPLRLSEYLLNHPYNIQYLLPFWIKLMAYCEWGYDNVRTFHLCGRYVKFSHMTKRRWEIIIEGSIDGKEWFEYEFKYKPSNIDKPLPIVPFCHMPNLDWRLWFLANEFARGSQAPQWFMTFLQRILQHDQYVLQLLGFIPEIFRENPPKYVQAVLYDYRYSYKRELDKASETAPFQIGRVWYRKARIGIYAQMSANEKTMTAKSK